MIDRKAEYGITKEQVYAVSQISRQGFSKREKRSTKITAIKEQIVQKVEQVRVKHKKMGSRPMYYAANISEIPGIGITKFERFMSDLGMVQKPNRKWNRTTISVKHSYPNLINSKVITSTNEVVVGDITYYYSGENQYYIFTLKDMYSKRILGLSGSLDMSKESALAALKQMFEVRKGEQIEGMIHHTDAGSQYLSKLYKDELKAKKIKISIAKNCLENGSAEQLNGVVKNDYLCSFEIRNLYHLKKVLNEIKTLINEQRPVAALGYRTPVEFENYINGLSQNLRPKVVLYDFNSGKNTWGDF